MMQAALSRSRQSRQIERPSPRGQCQIRGSRGPRLMAPVLGALVTLVATMPALQAQQPVNIQVQGDAPNAYVRFDYNGSLVRRAQPVAVFDTFSDRGKVRIPLTFSGRGRYEGFTTVNQSGTFSVAFEGTDLIEGGKLTDNNDGNFYSFSVATLEEREQKETAARNEARRFIRRSLPQFRKARSIFFRSRQPAGGRDAIVRSEDGRNVWVVRVSSTGRQRARILERVR